MLENQKNTLTYTIRSERRFAFPVRFNDPSEIRCWIGSGTGTGSELLQNIDFAVEALKSYRGGSYINLLMKVLPAGSILTIAREIPFTQMTAFPTHGQLDSESVENALDRIVMMCQQLASELDRVEKLPEGETSILEFLEHVELEATAARDIALDASVSASKSAQLSFLGAKAVANIYTQLSGDPDKANAMLESLQAVSAAAGAVASAAAAAKSSIAGQEDEVKAALKEAAERQKKALESNYSTFEDQLEDLLSARLAEANGATSAALKAALAALQGDLSSAVQRAKALATSLYEDAERTALDAIDKANEKLEEVVSAGNAAQTAIESQRLYALQSIYKTLFDATYDAEQTFNESLNGLYRAVEELFASDGVITAKEREILDKIEYALAEAVAGDAGALAQIQQAVAAMISEDGDLSAAERQALEAIAAARQAAEEAMERYHSYADTAFGNLEKRINELFLADGIIDQREREFLAELEAAKAAALDNADTEALAKLRARMEEFFREDGVIDQREEEILARIDAAIASAELQVVSAMGAVRLRLIAVYEALAAYYGGSPTEAQQAILAKLAAAKTNAAALAAVAALRTDLTEYFGGSPTAAQQAILDKLADGGTVQSAARAFNVTPLRDFRAELASLFGSSPSSIQRGLLSLADDLITAATPIAAGEVYTRTMDGYTDKLEALRDTLSASFGQYPYPANCQNILNLIDYAIAEVGDSTLGQQRTLEKRLAEIRALLEEYFGADGIIDEREKEILDALEAVKKKHGDDLETALSETLKTIESKLGAIFNADGVIDQKEAEILARYKDTVNGETSLDAFTAALVALWPAATRTTSQQYYLDQAAAAKTAALKGDVSKLEMVLTLLEGHFGEAPAPAYDNVLNLLKAAIQKVKESALYVERERVRVELEASQIAALDAALAANKANGAAGQALAYAQLASDQVGYAKDHAATALNWANAAEGYSKAAATSAASAQSIADAIQKRLDNLNISNTIEGHDNNANAHVAIRNRITALETGSTSAVTKTVNDAITAHNKDANAHTPLSNRITANASAINSLENRLDVAGIAAAGTDALVVWGTNAGGQSGVGHKKVIYSPECLAYPLGISHASFFDKGGLAIFGGKMYVTGTNSNGFSGPGRDNTIGWQPLTDMAGWTRVSCCANTGAAIRNKVLFTWGNGSRGAGGRGDNLDNWLPKFIRRRCETVGGSPVEFEDDWIDVVCGNGFTLALTNKGTVYAAGRNNAGQLGLGNTTHQFYFTKIPGLSGIQKIAAGGDAPDGSYRGFAAAIGTGGALYTWGSGTNGRTGQGATANCTSPKKIGTAAWRQIACGYRHLAAVTSGGALMVAGAAAALGVSKDLSTLTQVAFSFGAVPAITADRLAAGRDCTFVMNSSGQVFSFGGSSSGKGKLGRNVTGNQPTPTRIGTGATAVYGGCTNYGGAYITDKFDRGLYADDSSDEDTE